MNNLGFNNFAGLNTAGADQTSFDCSVLNDFDFLEVRKEATQAFSDDLRTSTAFSLDHTASFIFIAWDSAFIANDTSFHELSSEND